jgi:hypothetical protein
VVEGLQRTVVQRSNSFNQFLFLARFFWNLTAENNYREGNKDLGKSHEN